MRLRPFWITLLLCWSLAPMLWQLISSFSTSEALISPTAAEVQRWTLDNYRILLNSQPPFWTYLINSSIVASATTLFTLGLALPASYALARSPANLRRSSRLFITAAALFPYVLLFLALLELARTFSL